MISEFHGAKEGKCFTTKNTLLKRKTLVDVVNRFEDMKPIEVFRSVDQMITNITNGTLDLGKISNSIQAITNSELSPARAAFALDMVVNMKPGELKKFLIETKFGRKAFRSVRREMLLLNHMLQSEVPMTPV